MENLSKEKQIEEMQIDLMESVVRSADNGEIRLGDTAKNLYDKNYRKQSEGEWVFNRGRTYGEPAYYCSECSEGASEYGHDNFCPNCGAKMKGGE